MSNFTVTFWGSEEAIRAKSDNELRWYKKDMGSTLLAILNADLDYIEGLVGNYPVEPITTPFLVKQGYEYSMMSPPLPEYETLIKHFFPFTAYQREDWESLYFEIFPQEDYRGLREVLSDIKAIIDIVEHHPEYINYSFLSRYLAESVVFSDGIIHVEEYKNNGPFAAEELEMLFGQSVEDRISKTYQHFLENTDNEPNRYKYTIPEYRLEGIAIASILEITRCGKIIKKCRNCGRYFIPPNRSDAIYCNNPSPMEPELSCKEYGTRRLWYERQKEDEIATLSRKIASAKSMLAKRNKDIPEYAQSYDYFRTERKRWKKAVEEGTRTREDYRTWLLLMQSQKVIKEAVSDPE